MQCLFVLHVFLQNILSIHKINNLDKENNTNTKHGRTPNLGWDDRIWVGLEHVGEGASQPHSHTTKDNHETPIKDNLSTAFVVTSLPQKPSACMEEISIKLTKSVQYLCSSIWLDNCNKY